MESSSAEPTHTWDTSGERHGTCSSTSSVVSSCGCVSEVRVAGSGAVRRPAAAAAVATVLTTTPPRSEADASSGGSAGSASPPHSGAVPSRPGGSNKPPPPPAACDVDAAKLAHASAASVTRPKRTAAPNGTGLCEPSPGPSDEPSGIITGMATSGTSAGDSTSSRCVVSSAQRGPPHAIAAGSVRREGVAAVVDAPAVALVASGVGRDDSSGRSTAGSCSPASPGTASGAEKLARSGSSPGCSTSSGRTAAGTTACAAACCAKHCVGVGGQPPAEEDRTDEGGVEAMAAGTAPSPNRTAAASTPPPAAEAVGTNASVTA